MDDFLKQMFGGAFHGFGGTHSHLEVVSADKQDTRAEIPTEVMEEFSTGWCRCGSGYYSFL